MAPTQRRTTAELEACRAHAADLLRDGAPPALAARILQQAYGISRSGAYRDLQAAAAACLQDPDQEDHHADTFETRDYLMQETAALAAVALAAGDSSSAAKLLAQWHKLASMGNVPGHDGHASRASRPGFAVP